MFLIIFIIIISALCIFAMLLVIDNRVLKACIARPRGPSEGPKLVHGCISREAQGPADPGVVLEKPDQQCRSCTIPPPGKEQRTSACRAPPKGALTFI